MSERRGGIGLRTRLLALVLVPVVLLGALTVSSVAQRRSQADAAAAVERQVAELTKLVDLSAALLLARTPVEVEVRAGELGLDPGEALALLDLDPAELGDLDAVTAALRALPSALRPFEVERVDELARRVAAGPAQAQLDAFHALELLVESDFERQVVTLRDRVVGLGDRDLARTAEDLIATSRAGSATASLLVGLADHWFSSLEDPGRAERARIALSAPAEQFDAAIRQLRTSPDAEVAAASASIARLRDEGPFGGAIDAALAGRDPAPFADGIDLSAIVATFTDSFAELQPLLDLMAGRSAELSDSARTYADRSSREADRNLAALVGLGLLLVLLCLWVVRSIDQPLRQLIDAMRRVGGGDLSGSLLHHGGPPEVADASGAFNDVLVNLRLLDGK
ncbi:MAG TPA: HAMP domain-containing protein, partial [Aquihabitans sp.]|nr:HAMP domain-containing protein [Aquihabitans sp.]